MTRRRAVGLAAGALVAAAAGAAGCSGVLGMDAPTLDPCAHGGCADATAADVQGGDVQGGEGSSTPDAAPEADAPATGDASPEACAPIPADGGNGIIRCGGGCFPAVYCSGTTPVCCQSTDDAGITSYACTSSETTCGGYAIKCLNENDCGGSDVCCHFNARTVCDTPANCPSAQLACIPGSVNDCPTGKQCDVQLVNAGVPAPYFGCEP